MPTPTPTPTHTPSPPGANSIAGATPRVRGVLHEVVEATATQPGYIVLGVPGTSYRLHLRPTGPIDTPVGKRVEGVVRCEGRRLDRIEAGGRYVEPVIGRPRRIQGRVISTAAGAGSIVVDAGGAAVPGVPWGLPVECVLTDTRSRAVAYAPCDLVTFEVHEGATFTQAR